MDNEEVDCLDILRMQYAEELERVLECMVCFEIPVGEVRMCVAGHHICSTCQQVLIERGEKCPECNLSFSSARNYAVEKLCETFTNIRSSILDPKHASNWRKMISTGTQTDPILVSQVTAPIVVRKSSRIKNATRQPTSEQVNCSSKLINGQNSVTEINDNCNLNVAEVSNQGN
ncbi:hypothetical protein QAD02_008560 [Eretmocerus hayati]|uniref:Uncharacterized protein n=1 Tax=Eretmocerus hayati TaxID=131215 RepID=A0ACC2N7G0_9HYME|nr:hypothetical protein QAD02_008560 [Eretmocerus hayati]